MNTRLSGAIAPAVATLSTGTPKSVAYAARAARNSWNFGCSGSKSAGTSAEVRLKCSFPAKFATVLASRSPSLTHGIRGLARG
jgi:hypothetical protein